jgi:hypothetical protein
MRGHDPRIHQEKHFDCEIIIAGPSPANDAAEQGNAIHV